MMIKYINIMCPVHAIYTSYRIQYVDMSVATCVAHMNCTIKINGFFVIFINGRISMPSAAEAASHALAHISANVNICTIFSEQQPTNRQTDRPFVNIITNFILFSSTKKMYKDIQKCIHLNSTSWNVRLVVGAMNGRRWNKAGFCE